MDKHTEDICQQIRILLSKTDRFKELYQMTYIGSQKCVIAYFHGRRIIRVWVDDKKDDLEMIQEIIKVLSNNI